MLVRCEHCGSALPQEASKCFKCGNKRTPQIYSRTEVEVSDLTLEGRQRRWRKLVPFMATALILFATAAIMCLFAGFYLDEYITLTIGTVCMIASFALGVFIYNYEETLKTKAKVIEENPPEKVDEAEYEQRIRDFINY